MFWHSLLLGINMSVDNFFLVAVCACLAASDIRKHSSETTTETLMNFSNRCISIKVLLSRSWNLSVIKKVIEAFLLLLHCARMWKIREHVKSVSRLLLIANLRVDACKSSMLHCYDSFDFCKNLMRTPKFT